jgi:hypothetical protein
LDYILKSSVGLKFRKRGLFVTNKRHIGAAGGGVQTCTREYLKLFEEAEIEIDVLEVDIDRTIIARGSRFFRTSAYTGSISKHYQNILVSKSKEYDYILLNQVNLSKYASLFSDKIVILLSHGAEVTDLLNTIRIKSRFPLQVRLMPTPAIALYSTLSDEIAARNHVSGALCLSTFDTDFERWLGVKHAIMVPRTVTARPLALQPISGRFGFLGTLDHAPNLEGLVSILEVLDKSGLQKPHIRVVGGPEKLGAWLSNKYKAAHYLGPLADDALLPEASTWNAFLNPIFCQARGCSTKVATALGWEMPVITTTVGRRGYNFSEGSLIEANTPELFLHAMLQIMNLDVYLAAHQALIKAARSCPSMKDNALAVLSFLEIVTNNTGSVLEHSKISK